MRIRTYQDAAEYLGAKSDRPLANNTRLQRRDDGAIAVRLHSTDVVIYRQDGTAELYTGGWRTVTTKDRINTFSPARVYAERGRWYVSPGAVVFADGLRVSADGTPLNGGPEPADEREGVTHG
jgi:DNA helicase TIP49 (TBP-interacting protein)